MLKAFSSITNAIGALNYKGTWNASTNTPTLADGTGAKGDYYVVSTAGTQTFDGILLFFGAGDWIVYNGAVWQRVEGGADLNGVNLSVSGTTTLSGLTASTVLALDASKNVVSVTNTGTGNNVLATAPTLVGDVTLSTGNLVVSNGYGIDFSATSGTGTSELFDDYEEGIWTPDLQFGGVNTGITYVLNNGFYTKTGNIVSGTCWILLSSKGAAIGDATIAGLPFANAGSDGNQSPCPTDSSAITFADQMIATVEKIFTYIKLREVTNGGANSALTDADFGNSSSLQISFQYRAA